MHSHTPPGEPSRRRPLVYLAEDDDDIRETLRDLFEYDGFAVRTASDGTQLFQWLFCERGPGVQEPDVIVTDHRMPGYSALDILENLHRFRWPVPVVVITAYGPEVHSHARLRGARAVFDKPFDPDDLRVATMQCVDWNSRGFCPAPRSDRPGREIVDRARTAIRSEVEKLDPNRPA